MRDDRMISILTGVVLMLAIGILGQRSDLLNDLFGSDDEALILIDDTTVAEAGDLTRIDALRNDRGLPDDARSTLRVVEQPGCGTVYVQNGALQFIGDESCVGNHQFRYALSSDPAQTATVEIAVRVSAPKPGTVAEVPSGTSPQPATAPVRPAPGTVVAGGVTLPEQSDGAAVGAGSVPNQPGAVVIAVPKAPPARVPVPLIGADQAVAAELPADAPLPGIETPEPPTAPVDLTPVKGEAQPTELPAMPAEGGSAPSAPPALAEANTVLDDEPVARIVPPAQPAAEIGDQIASIGTGSQSSPHFSVPMATPAPEVGFEPVPLPGHPDTRAPIGVGSPQALDVADGGAPSVGEGPEAKSPFGVTPERPRVAALSIGSGSAVGPGAQNRSIAADPLALASEPRPDAPIGPLFVLPQERSLVPSAPTASPVDSTTPRAPQLAALATKPRAAPGVTRDEREPLRADPVNPTLAGLMDLTPTVPEDTKPPSALRAAPIVPRPGATGHRGQVALGAPSLDPLALAGEPRTAPPARVQMASLGDEGVILPQQPVSPDIADASELPGSTQTPRPVDRRIAALTPSTDVCTTEPEFRVLQEGAGFSTLVISAPCQANSIARLTYEGLRLGVSLNSDGAGQLSLPGVRQRSDALLEFEDGSEFPIALEFRDMRRIQRLILSWDAPVEFDLHAFEGGARNLGDPGHVGPGDPRSFREVRVSGGGFLTEIPATGPGTNSLVVYTFWQSRSGPQGVIRMELDFVSRRLGEVAACGENPLAAPEFRFLVTEGGTPKPENRARIVAIDCAATDALSETFVRDALPNLVVSRR